MKNLTLVPVFVLQFALALPFAGAQELDSEVRLGLSYILKFNGVARDLELTEEQNESVMGLWVEIEYGLEHAFQNYHANYSPRFSAEELERLKQDLVSEIDEVRKKELERLTGALTAEQLVRLKQIRFQILQRNSDGLQALVVELALSGEQVAEIKKVKQKFQEATRGFLEYAGNEKLTSGEIAEEVSALRVQHEKDLLEILSASQRVKLKELEGKPFELQRGTPKPPDKQ